jgi:hypothetical protein
MEKAGRETNEKCGIIAWVNKTYNAIFRELYQLEAVTVPVSILAAGKLYAYTHIYDIIVNMVCFRQQKQRNIALYFQGDLRTIIHNVIEHVFPK